MLRELDIKNLGPIREAHVDFSPQMTAITGETGAGKSMLLSALNLVRGSAVQASRISAGSDQAWAQAIFDVTQNPSAVQVADQAGVSSQDGEIFLARQVPAHGRSKAIASGHTVPRSVLSELCSHLITIHGQADQLRFISGTRQLNFLDTFSGNSDLVNCYTAAWKKYEEACQKLDKVTTQRAQSLARADYLRESIAMINRVDPHQGEDTELIDKRTQIENSAAISSAVSTALQALDSSQLGQDQESVAALDLLAQASQALRTVSQVKELTQIANTIDDVSSTLSDLIYTLVSHSQHISAAGDSLDDINARIHDLNDLERRWGPDIATVLKWKDAAESELNDIDASPEKIDELTQEKNLAYDHALQLAKKLHSARLAGGKKLSQTVNSELDSLAMAGAQLVISVTERSGDNKLNHHGCDDVEFLFKPFLDSAPLPLGKSASGGELSRLMLSLELALASQISHQSQSEKNDVSESGLTFVFDEVDAGVGGQAAVELGKRLAQLALTSQVIVVTHLAQVASWAQRQYVVAKSTSKKDAVTHIREVTGDNRIAEIARMLSGSESATSLHHAQELLETSSVSHDGKKKNE